MGSNPYGQPANGYYAAPMAIKPGIVPLRPLRLGEILDGAFQAIRSNPRTMLGISLVVALVVSVLGAITQVTLTRRLVFTEESGEDLSTGEILSIVAQVGATALSGLLSALTVAVLTAILALAVMEAVLGRKLSPAGLSFAMRGRWWPLIGLIVVEALALLAIAVASITAMIAIAALDGPLLLIAPILVAMFVAIVYLSVRWSLATAAFTVERLGVLASLARSGTLARGSWWRLFGIQFLAGMIIGVASQVLGVPAVIVSGLVIGNADASVPMVIGGGLVMALFNALMMAVTTPFTASVTALLYIDRRMRSEGFDVELARLGMLA